ncbi:MAG: hypothetical protein ACLFRD_11475, partial [Nitriliruptoraceae bacterium]
MATSTTAERTWPTRLIALAAALAIAVTGLVATSGIANADHVEDGIQSPSDGDELSRYDTLELRAAQEEADSVQWAVRIESSDPQSGPEGGENVAGNVADVDDDYDLDDDGHFSADLDISDWVPDTYYFVFNPSPGGRYVVEFEVIDPLADFDDSDIDKCAEDEECSREVENEGGQTFSATATGDPKYDGGTSLLGLRVPSDETAVPVSEACDALVDDSLMRLGGGIAHLVPVGFAAGDVTVTSTIPREEINSDEPRGNPHFQV